MWYVQVQVCFQAGVFAGDNRFAIEVETASRHGQIRFDWPCLSGKNVIQRRQFELCGKNLVVQDSVQIHLARFPAGDAEICLVQPQGLFQIIQRISKAIELC